MDNYYFQLASDIHIEKKYPKLCSITDFIIPVAKNLILAGDIGSVYYKDQLVTFFQSCTENFESVIFVPGNNEYYTKEPVPPMSFKEANAVLYDICVQTGVILLNNMYLETPDLIIFGSTWWSLIPDSLNMRIMMDNSQITADEFNFMHITARLSLNSVIEKKGTKKLLVITHYCPTKIGTMNNHHLSDEFKSLVPYYFSSEEKFLKSGKIDAWIFGHTHVFRDFVFEKSCTRIMSNADPRKNFFRKNFAFSV